jgi:hypothetical protein
VRATCEEVAAAAVEVDGAEADEGDVEKRARRRPGDAGAARLRKCMVVNMSNPGSTGVEGAVMSAVVRDTSPGGRTRVGPLGACVNSATSSTTFRANRQLWRSEEHSWRS